MSYHYVRALSMVAFAALGACHPLHRWNPRDNCDINQVRHAEVLDAHAGERTALIDANEIAAAIRAQHEDIQTCYRWVDSSTTHVGRATFHFLVTETGSVRGFHLDNDTTELTQLACCLEAAADGWELPAEGGRPTVEINYDYAFNGDRGVGPGLPDDQRSRDAADRESLNDLQP